MQLNDTNNGVYTFSNSNGVIVKCNAKGNILNIGEFLKSMDINEKVEDRIHINEALRSLSGNVKAFNILLQVNDCFKNIDLSKELKKAKSEANQQMYTYMYENNEDEDKNKVDIVDELAGLVYLNTLTNSGKKLNGGEIKSIIYNKNKSNKEKAIILLKNEYNKSNKLKGGYTYTEQIENIKKEIEKINNDIGRVMSGIANKDGNESELRRTLMELEVYKKEFEDKLIKLEKDVYVNDINIDKLNIAKKRILLIERILSNIDNVDPEIVKEVFGNEDITENRMEKIALIIPNTISPEFTKINDNIDVMSKEILENANSSKKYININNLLTTLNSIEVMNSDKKQIEKINLYKNLLKDCLLTLETEVSDKELKSKQRFSENKNAIIYSFSDELVNNHGKDILYLNKLLKRLEEICIENKVMVISHNVNQYARNADIENIVEWCDKNKVKYSDLEGLNIKVNKSENIIKFCMDLDGILTKNNIENNKNDSLNINAFNECERCWYVLNMKLIIDFFRLLLNNTADKQYPLNSKFIMCKDQNIVNIMVTCISSITYVAKSICEKLSIDTENIIKESINNSKKNISKDYEKRNVTRIYIIITVVIVIIVIISVIVFIFKYNSSIITSKPNKLTLLEPSYCLL